MFWAEKLHRSPAECLDLFAQRQQTAHPPEQRVAIALVRLNVDALVVILGIDDHGQDETLRIGRGKSGVSVRTPLHRSTYSIPIAKGHIVAHSNLIAVVNHRRSRQ